MKKRILALLLALMLALANLAALAEAHVDGCEAVTDDLYVEYGCDYSDPDEVALYLHAFEELPPNYITKSDARALGWDSHRGNLWDVAYGYTIGGDRFGNREGLLPAERLLFSDDGMICYSPDHYNSYELLYEEWYYDDGCFRGITEEGY